MGFAFYLWTPNKMMFLVLPHGTCTVFLHHLNSISTSQEYLIQKRYECQIMGIPSQEEDPSIHKVGISYPNYLLASGLAVRDLIKIKHYTYLFTLLGTNLLKLWCSKLIYATVEEFVLMVLDQIPIWDFIWYHLILAQILQTLLLGIKII